MSPRIALLAVTSLLAASAEAQDATIALATLKPDALNETYDEHPETSGSPLVGLQLGMQEGKLDPGELIFVLPPPSEFTERAVCIRATTQDGRYAANNRYPVSGITPESRFVRVNPATFEYREVLRGYDKRQFAARAFAADHPTDCNPADATHLPLVTDTRTPPSELIVFANGRSQLGKVSLRSSKDSVEPLGSAECTRAGSKSLIAYDLECRLDVKEAPERVVLELELDDGFSTSVRQFRVLLRSNGK